MNIIISGGQSGEMCRVRTDDVAVRRRKRLARRSCAICHNRIRVKRRGIYARFLEAVVHGSGSVGMEGRIRAWSRLIEDEITLNFRSQIHCLLGRSVMRPARCK